MWYTCPAPQYIAMRSDKVKAGFERAPHRSLMRATGMTDEDLSRPFIAICNSFNEVIPGHVHLNKVAALIKEEVRKAGGTPVEFNLPGVCDGIAMGHGGMKFSLASRELIADSVETMLSAHAFDAMICIPNCDKIVPGMIMGALLRFPSAAGKCEQIVTPILKTRQRLHPKKTAMATILIAEDDHAISDLVAYNLERAGHAPVTAYDGLTALEVARRDKPDLILLDQMMPGMDGHGVLRELRRDSRTQGIPVIFLTAKAQAEDRIQGLELGADDYVTKPFSPKELVLRVASVLKRCEHTPGSVIAEYGPFTFDKNALKFYIDKEEVDLTATEFKLMIYMIEREGQILNRNDLLSCVWGYSHQAQSRTLDTHMKRLRQKLALYADCIETVRSIGYRFLLPGRRPPQEPA